jgi:hypothetical protein
MHRYTLAVGLLAVSLVASAAEKPAKLAAHDPVMVVMELSQVEVNVTKLRRMGIDWKTLSENAEVTGNPAWLRKLAELMIENGLARNHASPKLATVVGRQAIFDVVATRATLLPRLVDSKIAVEVTLETYDPPVNEKGEINAATRGEPRTSLSTKTTCKPGQTVLLGQDASVKKNSAGEVTVETVTLTFLMADVVRPETEHAKKKDVPDLRPIDGPIVELSPLGSAVKPPAGAVPRRR